MLPFQLHGKGLGVPTLARGAPCSGVLTAGRRDPKASCQGRVWPGLAQRQTQARAYVHIMHLLVIPGGRNTRPGYAQWENRERCHEKAPPGGHLEHVQCFSEPPAEGAKARSISCNLPTRWRGASWASALCSVCLCARREVLTGQPAAPGGDSLPRGGNFKRNIACQYSLADPHLNKIYMQEM